MKKCRCPWCGTECIPAIDKVFQRRRWQGDAGVCPACHRSYCSKQKESAFPILYVLAVLLLCVPAFLTREPLWLMAMGAGVVSIPFAVLLYGLPRAVLVRYENGVELPVDSYFRADLAPLPDRERVPRLLDGDVLALCFDPSGRQPDSAVYPCTLQEIRAGKNGNSGAGIAFLQIKDIPPRFLCVGQGFTLIRQGNPVARGTFVRRLDEQE